MNKFFVGFILKISNPIKGMWSYFFHLSWVPFSIELGTYFFITPLNP